MVLVAAPDVANDVEAVVVEVAAVGVVVFDWCWWAPSFLFPLLACHWLDCW